MRRLRSAIGVIPRCPGDARRSDALHYKAYCIAVQAAWGPLPPVALPALREAGLVDLELQRLAPELEAARRRRRTREAARIRKQQFMLREQLARLESRLQTLATPKPRRPMDAMRDAPEVLA